MTSHYKIRKEFRPSWKPGTVQITEFILPGHADGAYVRIPGWGLFLNGRGVWPLDANHMITEATAEEVVGAYRKIGAKA